MSRNKLYTTGQPFEIAFQPLPHESLGERRLEIVSHGLALRFREVQKRLNQILREVEIPMDFLFDVWPTLNSVLTMLAPGEPDETDRAMIVAERIADFVGVYGAGPEGDHPEGCKCRMCFVAAIGPAIAKARLQVER